MMPIPKQEQVKVVFNKTIGQFKKWQEYELWVNLAKYWKRYVDVVTSSKDTVKPVEKKWTPKKAKNKAILSSVENK